MDILTYPERLSSQMGASQSTRQAALTFLMSNRRCPLEIEQRIVHYEERI